MSGSGLGGAFIEDLVYDVNGQLLTGNLATSAHRPVSAAVVALVRQRYLDFD